MAVRGIRGATTVSANSSEAILDATCELLAEMIRANNLREADIASVYFTVTPDLDAAFPARAARELGWTNTALLDAQAPHIAGDLPRCIRVLIHWNTEKSMDEIQHIYLRDARALRPDLSHLHLRAGQVFRAEREISNSDHEISRRQKAPPRNDVPTEGDR